MHFERSVVGFAAVLALSVSGLVVFTTPASAHPIPTSPKGKQVCVDYGQTYVTPAFNGIFACSGPKIGPIEFHGAGGALITSDTTGFQCVELATRYFYSAFGIPVQDANGDEIVTKYWSYIHAHPSAGYALEKVTPKTAKAGSLAPGDVVSYATLDGDGGHVDIVTKVTPSPFKGTGTITTLNENEAESFTIHATDWQFGVEGLQGGYLAATGWLHSTGAPSPPPTKKTSPPPTNKTSVAVQATANIFGAGRATPPDPGGSGGGVSPPGIALPAGTYEVEVDATGSITCCAGPLSGPAGTGGSSDISAPGSGLSPYEGAAFALTGVFLGPGPPTSGTGPPAFVTATAGDGVETPGLYQVFEVGTGSIGSSSSVPRDFVVPHGATRFFLGLADGWGFGGTAGYYSDNAGTLHATVTMAPTHAYRVIGISQLDEHSGPLLGDAVIGTLPDHATIGITCQTTGSRVEKSSIWDRLTNGSYIPDWYTTTPDVGKYSPPILRC
ncbi:MAG: CHAP domain-containing protein [Acidimicrobiales bacterium]